MPLPTVPDGRRSPSLPKLSIAALALLVAGISVVTAGPGARRRRQPAPKPRKPVEIERYLGRWYEFARFDAWFERGTEVVTADYSWRPDGLIRVVNAGHKGGLDGPLRWREAKARAVPGTGQSKLRVCFFGIIWGDYWILDHAEDYSWSIVGEGSRRYLWILTRKPHPSAEERAELFARVASFGYDTRRLHVTVHPLDQLA
ncbi:MAG TPA: lipocalin family protein [Acidisoma sp.]|nr:lipocalin family protein [Acidisoma sp.]